MSKEAVKAAKLAADAKNYSRLKVICDNALVLDPSNTSLLLFNGLACTHLDLVRSNS
jgi:hypothetical protein